MMLIKDIFSRDIGRDIKEVIKVDDRDSILEEIEEYIATTHIQEELVQALEVYQDTINNPSEDINIWISGFFGSGKSSFAKVFGYLLSDPQIDGQSVVTRFFDLNDLPHAKALLNTIHKLAPTEVILLDLNTSPNMLEEGEPILLPVYRTLLEEFGYSNDVTLAELEFGLEDEGVLDIFTSEYEQIYGVSWATQRHIILAKNRASRVLHKLDDKTYPAADSWSNAAEPPTITAKWFARRALEMLKRRSPGKARLVLVVDEVGQYVSRSTDRMRHLQGLAEECQKTKGRLWLVATSQEKLTDVVDGLEGKQIELAKAQDRFPIRIDLLPSDINEVTSKRVLAKTASGAVRIQELLNAHRNKLSISVTPESGRSQSLCSEDFVRLYPLVPYQLQVLINAVSARRAQGEGAQTMGGSNRTIIRHTQQLIRNPTVGLASEPVGSLITLDRSYSLLEEIIPTSWRHEVDQVTDQHGDNSLVAKIIRVIALCADVPGLPMTARNLAVVLHPSMSADPMEAQVREALNRLVDEDRIRESDHSYRLQSPEQKNWEQTRRGIDMKPGDAARLRKRLLKESLSSLTVRNRRTFKVELFVENERVRDGDIALDIREGGDLDDLRRASRTEEGRYRIYWTFAMENDTWDALADLHRSTEMINRHNNASQTDAQRGLLAEERNRRDRTEKTAEHLLARDLTAGTTIFGGVTTEAPPGELRASASRLVSGNLERIYPKLDVFAGSFRKADIFQILQAESLEGIPEIFGNDGLGLFRVTAAGREIITDTGPVTTVMDYIQARQQYGENQNGGQLEQYFAGPPYGAPVESLQATLAMSIRAELLEVISQASIIDSATDRRLEQVFGSFHKFRAATFRPAEGSGPSLEVRSEVSEWLSKITGEPLSLSLSELADTGRNTFGSLLQPCTRASATLSGAELVVPEVLVTFEGLLVELMDNDDISTVETIYHRRADLQTGHHDIKQISVLVNTEIDSLRAAARAVILGRTISPPPPPGRRRI